MMVSAIERKFRAKISTQSRENIAVLQGIIYLANCFYVLPLSANHLAEFQDMSQLMKKLTEVTDKVKRLGIRVTELNSENEALKTQLADTLQQLEQKKHQLSELGEKQKLIMLARSLPTDESRKDVKLKINDMVREIDKCISLLNS